MNKKRRIGRGPISREVIDRYEVKDKQYIFPVNK